ncbi:MAG: hypothetical protein H7Y43_00075 [Akkermansiaceae bacterium]|nr:hypothetical protein [Verrucomicrobiales bacterium]
MQTTYRHTNGSKAPGQVMIVYETGSAREQAAHLCRDFFEDSSGTTHWCASLQLKDKDYAAEMSRHAITADLIVFTGEAEGDFPQEVKLWIDRWLYKRNNLEGAMVGLFSSRSPGAHVASRKEVYLRHIARQAGLDYLCQPPRGAARVPDSLDTFNQRAGQVTSVLHEILENRTPPTPRL